MAQMMTFRQSLIWTTVLGFCLGAIVGVMLALLHAPTPMYFMVPAVAGGLLGFGIQRFFVRHS